MSSSKVAKNTAFYLVASFLPYVISIGTLPLYTRYLNTEDYGVLTLAQSFGAFLPILMSLQLHSSIYRFFVEYEGDAVKKYLSSVFIFLIVILGLSGAVIYFSLPFILGAVFPNTSTNHYELFEITVLISAVNVLSGAQTFLIRMREKAKEYMFLSMSLLLVSIAFTIIEVVVLERGAYGMMEATLLSSLLSLVVYYSYNKQYFILSFDYSYVKEPLLFSLPLIIHSLSNFIFMYSDRIILEKYVPITITLGAIGLYALADKVAFVMKTLVNQINEAYVPHFYKTYKKNPELAIQESYKTSAIVVALVTFSIVVVALFSEEIVRMAFTKDYYAVWPMIPLLCTSFLFRALYNFSTMCIVYQKKTWYITFTTLCAAVVNIIVNFTLIPIIGIYGAIFATVAAFFTTFLVIRIFSKKVVFIPINDKLVWLSVVLCYSIIALVYFLHQTLDNKLIITTIKAILLAIISVVFLKFKIIDLQKVKLIFKKE